MNRFFLILLFTSVIYSQKPKDLIIGGKIDRPEYINEHDSLAIRSLETINDNIDFCYKLKDKIKSNVKIFKDSIYNFNSVKYTDSKRIDFEIGHSNKIIFIKYKGIEKMLVFKNEHSVKFCGYRKFKDEMNFFFCVKNKKDKVCNFFIRVFNQKVEENDKRVYLTYYQVLPSISQIRNFCKSVNYWNDLTVSPCTPALQSVP
jgi:hypothetical protein